MTKHNNVRLIALVSAGFSMTLGSPALADDAALDFGDNSSVYANDGQCDDFRFEGKGMAEILLTDSIGRDANDCQAAFNQETIALKTLFTKPASDSAILFGDDASTYANDGECDDIRFVGPESGASIFLVEDVGHDASDCQAGFESGSLKWQGHLADIERGSLVLE